MSGYISEFDIYGGKYTSGQEFVEISLPTGTDPSGYSIYVYSADGTISQSALPLGTAWTTVDGEDIYVVDDTYAGLTDLGWDDAIALVDDGGNVLHFIVQDGDVTASEGPATGLTATVTGRQTSDGSIETDADGDTYTYTQTATPSEGTRVCYAAGTLIATPDGPRRVETLRMGDGVTTLDHGVQRIRWTHADPRPLDVDESRPVLIKTGALGVNLPTHDLVVSPQHRILVGGAGQLVNQFDSQALAPAKSLTCLPGVRHMNGKSQVIWVHFACDRHEIVNANGCWSESLLLGPMVLHTLTARRQRALHRIFCAPSEDAALNGPPARHCLSVGAARRQALKRVEDAILAL